MEFTKEEKRAIEVINEKIEYINNMPINIKKNKKSIIKNKSIIKFLVEVQKVANELVDIANEIIIRQQKEIKKEKSRIMELAELLDKQENEINSLQQELEIQKGCSISKDKIIKIIEHYNNELEHIKNGEEFENEKPMYYWGKVALEDLLEEN